MKTEEKGGLKKFSEVGTGRARNVLMKEDGEEGMLAEEKCCRTPYHG